MLPIFPHFKALTLEDKDTYQRLMAEYPPISDLSFASLQIWWNLDDRLGIADLNGNIVINYSQWFDEHNSGYCIIGKTKLRESIQTIFDYLKEQGKPIKLVHVPEFVITELKDAPDIRFEEELDYNEYIIESKNLAALAGTPHRITRRKIRRFWAAMENRQVEIRSLDLSLPEVKEQLYKAVEDWGRSQPTSNDPHKTELAAIKKTLTHAPNLGVQHLGVYIDGELKGLLLYHTAHDNNHYIIHHLKVDYSIPYIIDYLTHHIADKAVKDNIEYLNMEMDLGIDGLREHKMGLRPVEFFRKYTIYLAD